MIARCLSGLVVGLAISLSCGGAPKSSDSQPTTMDSLAEDNKREPASPDAGPARPTAPLGSYRSTHAIRVVCDKPDWCEQEVTDTLDIKAGPTSSISITVELVQANAHTCNFTGELKQVGDRAWQYQSPSGEPGCVLDLEWKTDAVTLNPEGCREFCGARASLFASFDYPPAAD